MISLTPRPTVMSPTQRRIVPIACLILVSGLLLTGLCILLDATAQTEISAAKASEKTFALVNVGKLLKSMPDEQNRVESREWFIGNNERPYYSLRESQAYNLNVVRSQKDLRAWLKKNLHTEYVGNTNILRVWLTDGSPQEGAIIVDTIVRGFLQHCHQKWRSTLQDRISMDKRLLVDHVQYLKLAENELRALYKVEPNKEERENPRSWWYKMERGIAVEKKGITETRSRIERNEETLRTLELPRIVKWASKPRPEK